MKTIGMIGGMSWESTASYYRLINEGVRKRAGGLHSAKIVMISVDFHEIEQLMTAGQWERIGELLAQAARRLEAAGAEILLLCTNTIHKVADHIRQAIDIPFLHLADATGRAIRADGRQTVGLLGTRFTMEQDFYRGFLENNHALNVLIPSEEEMETVNTIIFDELCRGIVLERSREKYLGVINSLQARGAEAVILGCTEIGLLIQPQHSDTPLYDTTVIHAEAAVAAALE